MLDVRELRLQNRDLWRDCFHDDEAFMDLYFSQVARPENTFWLERDEKLACVMQALTCEVTNGNNRWRAAYLSGIATRPEYRKQGLATTLLKQVHELMADRGVAVSMLIPASEELAEYYAKDAGYTLLTHVTDERLNLSEVSLGSHVKLQSVSTPQALQEAYAQCQPAEGCRINHTAAQLEVAMKSWQLGKGQVWALRSEETGDCQALAFCRRTQNGCVRVADCMGLNDDSRQQLLARLARLYHPERLELKKQQKAELGQGRPFAMARVLRPDLLKEGVSALSGLRLNLMLDE